MHPADSLTSNADDYCLAKPGQLYAIYLPEGGTTTLDLGQSTATFNITWYNPRTGGDLVPGSVRTITGPGRQSIGDPPADRDQDWVALIRAK
jgi:hypothetical protein